GEGHRFATIIALNNGVARSPVTGFSQTSPTSIVLRSGLPIGGARHATESRIAGGQQTRINRTLSGLPVIQTNSGARAFEFSRFARRNKLTERLIQETELARFFLPYPTPRNTSAIPVSTVESSIVAGILRASAALSSGR